MRKRGRRRALRLLSGALLLCAGILLAFGLRTAQAQDSPAQALDASLVKTVSTTPDVCGTETRVDVAPGTIVYICYTLTNTGTAAIDPFALIDNYNLPGAEDPISWSKPAGFLLESGATLQPDTANGLIHPVTANSSMTSYAGWGVASADGAQTKQVLSNETTINVVVLSMKATLGVSASSGVQDSNCTAPTVGLNSYLSPAYLCLTLTNSSSVTLTQHDVSIPGFGIRFTVAKDLGPSGTVSATIRITDQDNASMATKLSAPSMTSRAIVTSTNGVLSVNATSEPVVVNGPANTVQLQKTLNTDPNSCSTTVSLTNVAYGQEIYYCLVLINSASLTYTHHVFTEPALKIAGAFDQILPPGSRISVTNAFLQTGKGLAPVLGPFKITQFLNSTMTYTASQPALGYQAVASAGASVSVLTPTPTSTGPPTATNTPIAYETPIPTPSFTPIPPTPTATWTWTPSPTPTPMPTLLVFSTPGGLPPTPYPQIAALQPGMPGSPFTSPLDPYAAATATAQSLMFPTPVLDPFGATATAQMQYAFPTPVLDPFGATATAQFIYGIPTPVLDPFGATATAQMQYAFPTPVLDPFGATATAQAAFGPPTVDPFAATAAAQAATATAAFWMAQSPLATPAPPEVAVVPPGLVITITATFTPEPTNESTQRPILAPTPVPPVVDARSMFVRVLDSAGATLALLWLLGGSALFFITAGVLAGLSFRSKEQSRFTLESGPANADYVAQKPPGAQEQPQASSKLDNWPESLP